MRNTFMSVLQGTIHDQEIFRTSLVESTSRQPEGEQSSWVQVDALPAHCQMQVRAGGAPGAAAERDLLAFFHGIPFLIRNFDRWR